MECGSISSEEPKYFFCDHVQAKHETLKRKTRELSSHNAFLLKGYTTQDTQTQCIK